MIVIIFDKKMKKKRNHVKDLKKKITWARTKYNDQNNKQ